jgi:membrane associated rhomboid family serine protease
MKIHYNAPVILTFSIVSTLVLILSDMMGDGFRQFFTLMPDMRLGDISTYFRLFSYTLGHQNWQHWIGNASFLLLIGPIVEEKYGGRNLVMMMAFTAFITGMLHLVLFSSGAMGASGIVFMLILLSSFTNQADGKIPLTFLIVAILYLGTEVISSFKSDSISQFGHIIGGLCGAGFGFWLGKGRK